MTESAQMRDELLVAPELRVEAFIARWQASAASERSNYALFLVELCDLLGVERPKPATGEPGLDKYVFEQPVHFENQDGSTSTGFIDLYRHECFVLETKQGCQAKREQTLLERAGVRSPRRRRGHGVRGTETWDAAMLRARGQAEQYAKALPEWPPFLIVVDVGHSIETYADFAGLGKHYTQFPDTNSFRILLHELTNDEVRQRLRTIWVDPLSLDPSRRAAKATREIAGRLALLGRSLEKDGHNAERVALFLNAQLVHYVCRRYRIIAEEQLSGAATELTRKAEDLRTDDAEPLGQHEQRRVLRRAGRGHPPLQRRLVRKYRSHRAQCRPAGITHQRRRSGLVGSRAGYLWNFARTSARRA
jgi:hypothetical protein